MENNQSFYYDKEVRLEGVSVMEGNQKITITAGKAKVEIQIPKSIFLSNQNHELLVTRFIDNATKLIRNGRLGPSAGWFQDMMEIEKK